MSWNRFWIFTVVPKYIDVQNTCLPIAVLWDFHTFSSAFATRVNSLLVTNRAPLSFASPSLMAYTISHWKRNSVETSSYFRHNLLGYTSHIYWTVLPSLQVSFKDPSCNLNSLIATPNWMRCQIKRRSQLDPRHHHNSFSNIWRMQNLCPAVYRARPNSHWRFTTIPSTNTVNLYTVKSGYISFSIFDSPQSFRTSLICMLHDHSQTHFDGYDTSGRVNSPT